jgi:hypothetical protein
VSEDARYRVLGLAFVPLVEADVVVVVDVDGDVLVDVDVELVDAVEADDGLGVVVVELLISRSACVSAFRATVSASTPDFSFCIAWPRLVVVTPVVPLLVAPVVPVVVMGSPSILIPVIAALRSGKAIPRLFDTLTAATNWPKFLKPTVALFRLASAPNAFCTFFKILDLVDSFCATGLSGVHVVPFTVDPVPPELVVVEPDVVLDVVVVGDVVVVPELVAVRVMARLFVVDTAELPFGVADFTGFIVAPLEVDVVVAFGPADGPFVVCTFAVADAPPRWGFVSAGTVPSTNIIVTSPNHRVAMRMVSSQTQIPTQLSCPSLSGSEASSTGRETSDLRGGVRLTKSAHDSQDRCGTQQNWKLLHSTGIGPLCGALREFCVRPVRSPPTPYRRAW